MVKDIPRIVSSLLVASGIARLTHSFPKPALSVVVWIYDTFEYNLEILEESCVLNFG